jgi:hypothetical protein
MIEVESIEKQTERSNPLLRTIFGFLLGVIFYVFLYIFLTLYMRVF